MAELVEVSGLYSAGHINVPLSVDASGALNVNVAALTPVHTATDGSTTITSGGTAQNLFGGVAPANGFAIYNPDAVNDLWMSDSTTALANGTGSIRIAANGGWFETPRWI